jgi:hypothetical protein
MIGELWAENSPIANDHMNRSAGNAYCNESKFADVKELPLAAQIIPQMINLGIVFRKALESPGVEFEEPDPLVARVIPERRLEVSKERRRP